MMTESDVTLDSTARRAGALYLAMMPFGVFGIVIVPARLVVRGDAAATAERIGASEWLFRTGVLSHVISQVIFVFLVLALFRLLQRVSEGRARLMVVLALLGIPVAILSEIGSLAALLWLHVPAGGAFTPAQLQTQAMALLGMRDQGILLAQVFWGLWLFPLGALVYRSGFVPRPIGVLLVIAGAGYVIDSVTQLLSPGFPVVSMFTFVGELALTFWLLVRGAGVTRRTATAIT